MTHWVEIGRKQGESDEEWAAVCKDMAHALALAMETRRAETTGSVAKGDDSAGPKDNAHD